MESPSQHRETSPTSRHFAAKSGALAPRNADRPLTNKFDVTSFLRGFALIQQAVDQGVRSSHGFTLLQYRVLLFLDLNPEARASDIATALGIRASAASFAITQLVDGCFVLKTPSPDDARASQLDLTPAGSQALAKTGDALMSELRRQWRNLSPVQRSVVSKLNDPDHATHPSQHYLGDIDRLSHSICAALKGRGFTITQLLALEEVAEAHADKREIRPVEIERALDVRSNTLAAALKTLSGKGLIVERKTSRRAGTWISLSPTGQDVLRTTLSALTTEIFELLVALYDPDVLSLLLSINDSMVLSHGQKQ